ncbi:molybdopterin-dependent oxidoreductase [Deinococcus detaillensis]|uniref:Molybdopterin-dependent oxidoreductase n=1 Tax=Deinococcus detaillensis TaxID=2592048 RepID=A0A553UJE4_9DEIO|nr:molybdopterin-dependent oxidoreductase [Deinococcus detaillensis]TSA80323.1 molybdopterin-dependent oxidoreductase [Deinococcus detaillensis]
MTTFSAAALSRQVLLTCPLDCPDACRLKVTIERGPDGIEKATKVTGDPDHPITRGFACAKTVHYPARQNHPERPLYPMKRVGGELVRISWEQALDEIAAHLKEVLARRGPDAVLRYHYAGTMGLMEGHHVHSFFRALGAPELDETICSSAGTEAWRLGYGTRYAVPLEDVPYAKTIVLWGINSLSTHSHLTPFMTQARKNGAKIIHIDPYLNKTGRYADVHLKVRPGSDTALALGVACEIIEQGWTDENYLRDAAQGLEEFRAEAEQWTLERTAETTGLSASQIADLARAIGQSGPTYIRVGYGMTRHEGGGTALRAVTLLPALTGDWRRRGGGCALSASGAFHLNRSQLGAAHLIKPEVRHVNMNELADALEPAGGVEAAFIYNCNPAVVAPDSGRVIAGLQRPDLKVIVLEQAMTETVQLADYVLPATTFMEHPDIYTSYGHTWLGYNPAELAAPGEARPNSWVFQELGKRLGLTEPALFWTVDDLLDEVLNTDHPFLEGVTPEALKTAGTLPLNILKDWLPYAHGAPTPSGKVMFTPVPSYRSSTAPLSAEYPLRLLTPPAHHFLNSTYGMLGNLTKAEGTEPHIFVHPTDAGQLTHGGLARIISETGETVRRVRVTDETQAGVAVVEGSWWGLSAPDGQSINAVTAQTLTDLGGGSTFHGTRVRLEAVSDKSAAQAL